MYFVAERQVLSPAGIQGFASAALLSCEVSFLFFEPHISTLGHTVSFDCALLQIDSDTSECSKRSGLLQHMTSCMASTTAGSLKAAIWSVRCRVLFCKVCHHSKEPDELVHEQG